MFNNWKNNKWNYISKEINNSFAEKLAYNGKKSG